MHKCGNGAGGLLLSGLGFRNTYCLSPVHSVCRYANIVTTASQSVHLVLRLRAFQWVPWDDSYGQLCGIGALCGM